MDSRPAVLFDIDGTLIDSNYLHVQAWSEALTAIGHPVDDAKIHRAIGMDSAKLLDALLGDVEESVRAKAKSKHAKRHKKLTSRLRRFDGARELLAAVADRGLQVVLATSAPPSELADLRKTLDAEDYLSATTSSDDVETAKPEPDLITVALEKAGVTPGNAVMVGDAVWDGVAAGKAGVPFIGVLSGGVSAAELTDAGAIAVYSDVGELLAKLDDSPIAALLQRVR